PVANPGSATLYASGITTTTYNLQHNALAGATIPPALNFPMQAAAVAPSGGGTAGGKLATGTYLLSYTFVNPGGAETYASPTTSFSVTAGAIPQVTLPPLPGGVSGGPTTAYNIYLSGPTGDASSVVLYAAGVTTSTFNLMNALATGDTVRPP